MTKASIRIELPPGSDISPGGDSDLRERLVKAVADRLKVPLGTTGEQHSPGELRDRAMREMSGKVASIHEGLMDRMNAEILDVLASEDSAD